MLVSAILDAKGAGVATIPRSATVGTAVGELVRHRVGALVVSPGDGSIDGIVSERDVVHRLSQIREDLLSEPVSSIMSTDVVVCSPADTVDSLMALMTERRIRHVPVMEDDRLCGIVSIGDVVKSRMGELEKDRNELMEYITAR
ncbi:MAG: CBS domain-containing protein [Acidimicrobiales bacterium]|jgi:CBS domain-containing protein